MCCTATQLGNNDGIYSGGAHYSAIPLLFYISVMGNLCGKQFGHGGGHTLLGSSGGGEGASVAGRPHDNPRSAAAAAAENRLKAVSSNKLSVTHSKIDKLCLKRSKIVV